MSRLFCAVLALLLAACATPPRPGGAAFDAEVERLMRAGAVPGLALALIEDGQVVAQRAYGLADVASATPLRTDTIMYGASLTKAAFAYLVMQLVDEGQIALDTPLPLQLAHPLSAYPDFADLAADPRWRQVTPRMLLAHTSGLLNWRWINPDRKLDFKFDPGSRYVYSGEGIQLLQLIAEERSGRKTADLMQQRVFDRFGMHDSSMTWRPDFAGRATSHYDADGKLLAHQQRARARAAGSMDTTLADYARFLAAVLRGDGLSARAHAAMLSPQLAIVSPQQFPSHWPGSTEANRARGLAIGLGWPLFASTKGPAFFKEGSDDGTNNLALGFLDGKRGIVILSNSSNTTRIMLPLVEAAFGPTCLPWFWMGYLPWDRPQLSRPGMREQPVLSPGCGP
jgi:CubicO group peptidase (beta-lactamase class C family)